MIFSGLEKYGYVLLFRSPDEFYVKFTVGTETIKLSKKVFIDKVPTKNEVCSKAKYIIEYNSDYVLCEILEDLKYDEVFCQVLLCNSNIRLKVDYRRLFYLNIDDIIGDENCVSLKINDFSPIYPNYWNSDLIAKLKHLLTCEKFIFQFKSTKVDPSDGRYPVDILRFMDRQSVIEEFVDSSVAMRGSDYYKAALENEITQIFYTKKIRGVRYKISNPLVKEIPVFRSKAPPGKTLNVEAEPFTPTIKYSPLSTELANHEHSADNIRQLLSNMPRTTPKSLHNQSPVASPIAVMNPKSEHLTSNIINMLTEMYKDHAYKKANSPAMPISNYQSMFPGSVYFSKPQTTGFQSAQVPLMPSNLNVEIPKTMPLTYPVSPERNTLTDIKSRVSGSKPDATKSPNFYSSNPASCPPRHRNSLNDSFIFENSTDMILDVSSIPLPPDRGPTKVRSCHNISAHPKTLSPAEVSVADSKIINDCGMSSQQESSSNEDASNRKSPKIELTSDNCERNVADDKSPSNADSPTESLTSLKIEPFSNANSHRKLILPDTHLSSPFHVSNKLWSPHFPMDKGFPWYGNYNSIMMQPMPAYFLRHNNPLDFIHRENIFPFHPNFQNIPHQIFSSNTNFVKILPAKEEVVGSSPPNQFAMNKIETVPGESQGLLTNDTTIDSSFSGVATGPLIGMSQPMGNFYIQPVNLICYKPPI